MASEIAADFDLEKLVLVKETNNSEIKQKVSHFVEVFSGTSMFVTAQYFVNPFSEEDNGLKRPHSPWSLEDSEEEEERFEPVPSKKRKFSF